MRPWRAAQQYIDWARAATERLGDPEAQAFVLDSAGWAAWFRGEWTAAREAHERALALIRAIGPCRLTAAAHIIAGMWHYWDGAWADATRCLEEGIASAERSGDLQTLPVAHWILAEMELRAGCPEAAVARLEPLLDRPGLQESVVTGLPSTLLLRATLAWAHLERGATAAARDAAALTVARATVLGYRLPLVEDWRSQGMVCAYAGRWDEARRAFAEGLSLARALPYPYAEARLLHVYGEMHLQRGEPQQARERLEAALVIFRRLGARKDVECVEQALATLPNAPPRDAAVPARLCPPARQGAVAGAPANRRLARTERQEWALEHLHTDGPLSPRAYATALGVSVDTALRDLQELVDRGLVQAAGTTKNRRYVLAGDAVAPAIHRTAL